MQFNVVPRTGGLAINRRNKGKRGARQHNSHREILPFVETSLKQKEVVRRCY